MRLVSCYITAFGKFQNQAFDLSKDVVEIKENNGWGKTTLVSFIECMLFGMDASRGRQVAEDVRQKYQPFQGGGYGGSLTFSHQNNVYRIERTFGKTPAGDTVKLYDKNNLPSFAFGEHVENIGELLFGINRESYHRTAYIAQGEIAQQGIPEDTKARLVALLSVENDKQSGAQSALQRLEKAEGQLRGKRTKNGLLDQMDARLQNIDEEKRACQQAAVDLYSAQKKLQELQNKQEQTQNGIQRLSAERDTLAQNSERAAARARREEKERQIAHIEEKMDRLRVFFREIDPLTVNVTGIESAVQEYYQLQEWFQENSARVQELSKNQDEQKALMERYQTLQDELQSFERMLNEQNLQAQKAFRELQNQDKAQEKNRKMGTWRLLLALLLTLIGATQIDLLPIIGWPLVALGGGFIGYVFLATLLSTRFWKRPKWRKTFSDRQMNARYQQVKQECENLQGQLQGTAAFSRQAQAIWQQSGEYEQRVNALKEAIEGFLSNFAFTETYDYRAALAVLQDRCETYRQEYQDREEALCTLAQLPPEQDGESALAVTYTAVDLQEIQRRLTNLDQDRQQAITDIANLQASIARLEEKACTLADYKAEEQYLLAEKARLERKLDAVRTARTLLIQARENMASRYLQPVEKTSREYLQAMKGDLSATLTLAADGTVLLDDQGALRPLAYYSQGTKELVGFCTRIALVQAVYTKELPVLLLDDPFVHFDDATTAVAKRMVQKLAKTYQIIYCTCKEERRIR